MGRSERSLEHEQMNITIGAALIAGAGALLGVALGLVFQYLRARQDHKWALESVKREAYVEFLRSISASFAQAEADHAKATAEAKSHHTDKPEAKSPLTDKSAVNSHQSDDPENARLLAATAAIELLAEREIHEEVRKVSDAVIKLHPKIRADGRIAHDGDVKRVNQDRLKLVENQFKPDLGIPIGGETEHQSRIRRVLRRPRRSGTSGQPDHPPSS